MRINTNISAINAHRNLLNTEASVESSMQKLSSGFRINRAADDAAGLAISNNLRAATRGLTQASRNAEQANAVLQIAEGGAGTIEKMLERMKELAVQSASDSVSDTQRTSLDEEFTNLKNEIDRTTKVTKYQGTALLDGTATNADLDFQVGTANTSDDRLTITASGLALDTTTLSLNGTASSIATKTDAQTAIDSIDAAIDSVNSALGTIGAFQNRLDYAQSNIRTSIQNFTAAESVVRDVDMAEEMTKFSKANILQQAGTAMLAQANQSAQGVLTLLRG